MVDGLWDDVPAGAVAAALLARREPDVVTTARRQMETAAERAKASGQIPDYRSPLMIRLLRRFTRRVAPHEICAPATCSACLMNSST